MENPVAVKDSYSSLKRQACVVPSQDSIVNLSRDRSATWLEINESGEGLE